MLCLIPFWLYRNFGYKGMQKASEKQAIAKKNPTNSAFVGRISDFGGCFHIEDAATITSSCIY